MKSKWRSAAQNLAITIGATLLLLALLEAGVRLFAPVPFVASDLFLATENTQSNSKEIQSRSVRRWLQPNIQTRHTTKEFDVAVRTNQRGMRGPDFAQTKIKDSKRILFVGDSFTFGYGVEEPQRFSDQVEKLALKRGEKWQSLNMGVPSWGTADALLYLRETGLELKPDVVVACFYQNDIRDNADRQLFELINKKLFAIERAKAPAPSALAVTRDPINDKLLHVEGEQVARAKPPRIGFLVRNFHLARMVRLALNRREDSSQDLPAARRNLAEQLTIALLEQMELDCQKAGAKFLLIIIPDKSELELKEERIEKNAPLFQSWLHKREANTTLDLLPTLRAAQPPLFFEVDAHLNARGHEVAARAIETKLKELRL